MKAIIDKQTNKCKGFGFIDFETHEDARKAIEELQKKGYTAQLAKVKCRNIPIFHRINLLLVFVSSHLNNKNKMKRIYILLIWIRV